MTIRLMKIFIYGLILTLLLSEKSIGQITKGNPPNIICIFVDDQAYQSISVYNHPISKIASTPNIDKLAEHGVVFNQSFVENSICTPSRATFLTGLYSHQHKQTRLGCCLDLQKMWFPEILQENGYKTAVFGKWHLNVEPKGFDYYDLLFDQGEYYNPKFRTPETNGKFVKEEGYVTPLITKHAIQWLESVNKLSNPFFLLINHKAPHRNWMPDLKYLNLFNDIEFPEPATLFDDYKTRGEQMKTQELTIDKYLGYAFDLKINKLQNEPTLDYIKQSWPVSIIRLNDNQRKIWDSAYNKQNESFLNNRPTGKQLIRWKYQRYIKDYCRTVRSIDEEVGNLLNYLKSKSLIENTLIVFTSDQGFFLGEHGLYDKRFMYEEAFRTPLIISYPPITKKKSFSNHLVQNIDLAPTFLDIAQITPPEEFEGKSLLPILKNVHLKKWRDFLCYHFYDYPAVGNVRKHYGIRTKRYKLIHFYGEGYSRDKKIDFWEMYDLKKDPTEINNVFENKKYDKKRNNLLRKLSTFQTKIKITDL